MRENEPGERPMRTVMPDEAWMVQARRLIAASGPPKAPREWTVRLSLPEGRDPLEYDLTAIARELAPAQWAVTSAGPVSMRGATLAPHFRRWQLQIVYVPVGWPGSAKLADRWYLTDSAIAAYMRTRGLPDADDAREQARYELVALVPDASLRERDTQGRELWRCSRSKGNSLRWVVDPRPHPLDTRPRVLWVGYARPPDSVWRD